MTLVIATFIDYYLHWALLCNLFGLLVRKCVKWLNLTLVSEQEILSLIYLFNPHLLIIIYALGVLTRFFFYERVLKWINLTPHYKFRLL